MSLFSLFHIFKSSPKKGQSHNNKVAPTPSLGFEVDTRLLFSHRAHTGDTDTLIYTHFATQLKTLLKHSSTLPIFYIPCDNKSMVHWLGQVTTVAKILTTLAYLYSDTASQPFCFRLKNDYFLFQPKNKITPISIIEPMVTTKITYDHTAARRGFCDSNAVEQAEALCTQEQFKHVQVQLDIDDTLIDHAKSVAANRIIFNDDTLATLKKLREKTKAHGKTFSIQLITSRTESAKQNDTSHFLSVSQIRSAIPEDLQDNLAAKTRYTNLAVPNFTISTDTTTGFKYCSHIAKGHRKIDTTHQTMKRDTLYIHMDDQACECDSDTMKSINAQQAQYHSQITFIEVYKQTTMPRAVEDALHDHYRSSEAHEYKRAWH